MINILIADDSDTMAKILASICETQPDMRVVGRAKNGIEAVQLVKKLKPDIMTMDINMPDMDGLEATRLIMMQNPLPIVVVSSNINDLPLQTIFKALEAGAVSALPKPLDISAPTFKAESQHIIETLRAMSEIKVIKKIFMTEHRYKKSMIIDKKYKRDNYEVVAIGTSVGGPQTLKTILAKLPRHFPLPIVVVQHMVEGFTHGFAKWLDDNIELPVKYTKQNEILLPGTVYLAPDNFHLTVIKNENKLLAKLVLGKPISGFCPSITKLLQSVATVCGENAIGIILTGMGDDGARGLLELKKAHGHTLIQDQDSAVVFGMAQVAYALGAVDKIVPLEEISDYLINIAHASISIPYKE